jgi:formate hydrogenlyase subunit 4
MEWAAALKLFNYVCIGFALFIPWGLATSQEPLGLALSLLFLVIKLAFAGAGIALIETVSAKLRVFRAPEFLATAFLFAVLGLLVRLLLGT